MIANELIDITDGTGNNEYLLELADGGVADVTAQGEGSSELELNVDGVAEVITLNLEGDRNTAEIEGGIEELNVTTPGDRNEIEVTGDADVEVVNAQMNGDRNSIEIENPTEEVTVVLGDHGVVDLASDDNETVDVTLLGGDGMVYVNEAEDITISAAEGGNTFDVIAETISITAGGDDNLAYVSGTLEDDDDGALDFEDGALLNVDMTGTLYLGHPDDDRFDGDEAPGVTALAGSTIAGQSLDIFVQAESNLTQAELSGIDSVVMNETLRMTVDQFLDIGPEAFAAYQEEFGAQQSPGAGG